MIFYLVMSKDSKMPIPTGDRMGFKFYKSAVSAKIFAQRKNGLVLPIDTAKMYEKAENFEFSMDKLIGESV